MLKYGFVTNTDHKNFNSLRRNNVEEVLTALTKTKMGDRVNYGILQHELANRIEYKIVLFNGQGMLYVLCTHYRNSH